jgi:uncharacterized membrane protein
MRSRFQLVSALVMVLAIMDAVTTYVGVTDAGLRELNPIATTVIGVIGLVPTLMLRCAIAGLVVVALRFVAYRFPRWPSLAIGLGLVTAAWWAAVVVSNVHSITRAL